MQDPTNAVALKDSNSTSTLTSAWIKMSVTPDSILVETPSARILLVATSAVVLMDTSLIQGFQSVFNQGEDAAVHPVPLVARQPETRDTAASVPSDTRV